MTDEPTTAAGRALWLGMTGGYSGPFDASARAMAAELIAIEAEARREGAAEGYQSGLLDGEAACRERFDAIAAQGAAEALAAVEREVAWLREANEPGDATWSIVRRGDVLDALADARKEVGE